MDRRSDFKTAKGKLLKYFNGNKEIGCDDYGWGMDYLLKNKNIKEWENGHEAEAAVERHTAKSWDFIESNYERVKEIANLCKLHRIQLVLITTPCWYSYYNQLNSQQLEKMNELTIKIQKEFDLPYFDYLKDNRFTAEDFFDSNHLSDVGAVKFTKILESDILSYERSIHQ